MNIKYPANPDYLKAAQEYTSKAFDFTHNFSGYENNDKAAAEAKRQRMQLGFACQFMLQDWMTVNGLDVKTDNSSYSQPDEYDLLVNGYRIDCKMSIAPDLWPQVSRTSDYADVDAYMFLLSNKDFTFVQPRGAIFKDEFDRFKVKVRKGEVLPDTGERQHPLLCKMDYSYFINSIFLNSFDSIMDSLR